MIVYTPIIGCIKNTIVYCCDFFLKNNLVPFQMQGVPDNEFYYLSTVEEQTNWETGILKLYDAGRAFYFVFALYTNQGKKIKGRDRKKEEKCSDIP